MIKLFKVLAAMAGTWYFIIKPVMGKVTITPESIIFVAIAGAIIILSITIPFLIK